MKRFGATFFTYGIKSIALFTLCFLLQINLAYAKNSSLLERDDVKLFIKKMISEHNFNKDYLTRIFREMKPRPKIVEAISNPAEAKKWYQYRPIFIQKSRINNGVKFWNIHAGTLKRAQKEFGVPPEIVTAIVGIETKYGSYTGKYRVIDSLATLGFIHTNRTTFFRNELEHFLLLTREHQLDPFVIKGSYAGAMGKPQFISSSYRRYAVDYDGNGKINLWDRTSDVIGSVASYFNKHKWHKDEPVAIRAKVSGKKITQLLNKKRKVLYSLEELKKYGITPISKVPNNLKVNILKLRQFNKDEYWIVFHNFFVIMKYNHSELYAMSAHQLSQLIRKKIHLKKKDG